MWTFYGSSSVHLNAVQCRQCDTSSAFVARKTVQPKNSANLQAVQRIYTGQCNTHILHCVMNDEKFYF